MKQQCQPARTGRVTVIRALKNVCSTLISEMWRCPLRDYPYPLTGRAYRMLVDALASIHASLGFSEATESSIQAILNKLNINPGLMPLLSRLVASINSRLKEAYRCNIEAYQYEVPKLMAKNYRKRLAAYYTNELGARLMGEVARVFVEQHDLKDVVIADPFMGSGVTLTEAIKTVGSSRVKAVWGVEVDPLATLVAYAAILRYFEDRPEAVRMICSDAFDILTRREGLFKFMVGEGISTTKYEADIILTNPPFTRWENLEKSYKQKLLSFLEESGYAKYVTRRQLNLQTVSLFLIDQVLEDEGLLVSVLPASTFYTISGSAVKKLLRERYDVMAIISSYNSPSFSAGSGFEELIMIARKGCYQYPTSFVTIVEDGELIRPLADAVMKRKLLGIRGLSIHHVDLRSLSELLDMNWLLLFRDGGEAKEFLISTLVRLVERGKLVSLGRQLADRLIRGVEMFGPNFFLVPNDYWAVERQGSDGSLTIVNRLEGLSIVIPGEYLIRALRKPSLYVDKFVVEPEHYFIAIPPAELEKLPRSLRKYVEWGKSHEDIIPAIKNFGRFWYSHVYKQMRSKKPFGTLFLPDKIDTKFKNRGVFSVITREPVTATKNFYILKIEPKLAGLLTLWFNSSLFLGFFVYGSRRISRTWTRFLEEDYLRIPIPNLSRISEEHIELACDLVEKLMKVRAPPISEQENWSFREEIDYFITYLLEMEKPDEFVKRLHESLFEALR